MTSGSRVHRDPWTRCAPLLRNASTKPKKEPARSSGCSRDVGDRSLPYGRARADGPEITAETIFEIGSVTKVFTALLLADMAERGEVALDDPVRKYLPSGVTVPSRGRRDITLADLATHTSGLPRDPTNLDLRSLDDPYAEYRAADLHAFLAGYSLQRDPGTQFEYSNVGMGLLGHALATRAGLSYEALLTRRVLGPLGMRNTSVVVDEERRSRRATGHSQALAPVPWWHFDAMAGAGAMNSTAQDMLVFAEAAMGADTPLKAAFARMTSVRRPTGGGTDQVLGWDAFRYQGNEVLAKSGVTNGFRSRFFVDPTRPSSRNRVDQRRRTDSNQRPGSAGPGQGDAGR